MDPKTNSFNESAYWRRSLVLGVAATAAAMVVTNTPLYWLPLVLPIVAAIVLPSHLLFVGLMRVAGRIRKSKDD